MRPQAIGIIGIAVGGLAAFFGRPQYDAWTKSEECCSTKHAPVAQTCPAHFEGHKLVTTDQVEADRLRRALRDGVFRPWVELGRAPTPEEVGDRLHLARLVSAEPAGAIVFKGSSCDEMLFFSSQAGLDGWKKQHAIKDGKVFTLAEAVTRGATDFGELTEGLPD